MQHVPLSKHSAMPRHSLCGPHGSISATAAVVCTENSIRLVAIVSPETIIRWHRAGFRLYWRWRSRSRVGRPKVNFGEDRLLLSSKKQATTGVVFGGGEIWRRVGMVPENFCKWQAAVARRSIVSRGNAGGAASRSRHLTPPHSATPGSPHFPGGL